MEQRPDFQLIKIRSGILDLIKSFFTDEPDAERISLWRGVIFSLSQDSVTPEIDQAVSRLSQILSHKGIQELQDEYYELFINPFGRYQVNMTASYHLDGRNYGPTLAACRRFLIDAGIKKREGVTESEDSLPVMIDIYQSLVEAERKELLKAKTLQGEFLEQFLMPLSVSLIKALEENPRAKFYEGCCHLLLGYLSMEKYLIYGAT